MRSPSYLALLSLCLLSFLPACAKEEPLLEAKSSFGNAAEPLILCFNGQACSTTKGSCSGTGTCNSSGTCVVSSWCNDNNVCTTDSCVGFGASWYCSNTGASSFVACNDNSACTTGDHCNGSGTCIGGSTVDCADTNPCTNDSCIPASGCAHTNTSSGTSCTDNNACTSGDVCNGYGSCVGSTVVCNDGNSCTTDTCNSGTGCVYTFIGTNWSCNDNNLCTTNDRCNASQQCLGTAVVPEDDGNVCTQDVCIPATGNTAHNPLTGRTCNDGNACTVGDSCSNGACTNSTPLNCNDGNACTTDSCNTSTGCVYAAVVCTDTNPCTDNTCLPASGCSVTFSSTATSCNDGDLCTTGDHCNGSGSCISTPVVPENDNNPCTLDTCNPAAPGTLHTPTNQGLACDDNNACTVSTTCNAGVCQGGSALSCDDSNVCTTDACNTSTGCTHANNTVNCNDGNACTTGDKCGGGVCAGTAVPPVSDNNACTTDTCNPATGLTQYTAVANGTGCNDNLLCTLNDACQAGICTGTAKVCNDSSLCTTDSCEPSTGQCTFQDTCNDGNICSNDICNPAVGCSHTAVNCNDTNACTTDYCIAPAGCRHDAIVCNDNNECTEDSCLSASGCSYSPSAASKNCNDNLLCTTSDHCSGAGTCIGTAVIPQDDSNSCTVDTCDPSNPSNTLHTATNQGFACDDNNACTVSTTCNSGVCQGGSALNCADTNVCTTDGCNAATGCTHVNNTDICSDNSLCTLDDHCDGNGVCRGVNVNAPQDFNPCTADICNPLNGAIEHPPLPDGTVCDDSKPCTLNDSCQGGACGGTPNPCNDNDPCTADSCDPVSGCAHVAVVCDDNDACTDDSCDKQIGCVKVPKNLDDHNPCTEDICDPAAGQGHNFLPPGIPCDDGNPQTKEDFCDGFKCAPGLSCQPAVIESAPEILRRRIGRGRHVTASSASGQAVCFIEELSGKGGSVRIGVATFDLYGQRKGVATVDKVPFYADPVIAALPNGDYVLAYDSLTIDGDGLGVALVKVSHDGVLLSQPIAANTTKVFGQHSADMIWTGTELRLAWEDESEPGHRRICQARFNENLSPLSGEDCGSSAPELDRSRVSLAMVGQTPAKGWQETWQETVEPFNTKRRVMLQYGSVQTSFEITAAPPDESPALVELDATHILMVYPDNDGTQSAAVVNSAGVVVSNTSINDSSASRYAPMLTKIGADVYMGWMSPPAVLDGGWDPDMDDVYAQKLAWNNGSLDLDANAKFPIPFETSYRFGDQRSPAIAPREFAGQNAMWAAWEDLNYDKTRPPHGDVLVSIRVLP